MEGTLHLYGQDLWHGDSEIVGTRDALIDLKLTIEAALEKQYSSHHAFTSDGEGYEVHVHCLTNEKMTQMALPYWDEMARSPQGALWPWKLLKARTKPAS